MTAAVQGLNYLAGGEAGALAWLLGLAALLAGIVLAAGFLTPVAGAAVAFAAIASSLLWFPPPAPNLFEAALSATLVAVVSIAVIFLGPGAYSIDARLFGRREIIIPHTARSGRT